MVKRTPDRLGERVLTHFKRPTEARLPLGDPDERYWIAINGSTCAREDRPLRVPTHTVYQVSR